MGIGQLLKKDTYGTGAGDGNVVVVVVVVVCVLEGIGQLLKKGYCHTIGTGAGDGNDVVVGNGVVCVLEGCAGFLGSFLLVLESIRVAKRCNCHAT